jgi:hypothetical protein
VVFFLEKQKVTLFPKYRKNGWKAADSVLRHLSRHLSILCRHPDESPLHVLQVSLTGQSACNCTSNSIIGVLFF